MRRLFLLLVVGLAACGGNEEASDPLAFDHPSTRPQTACADATDEDAFVLALRYQTDVPFNYELASDYTWALSSARATYPELCVPRAFADMLPDMLVVRARDARAAEAWAAGVVETGIQKVDELLARVGVTAMTALPHARGYELTLAQPVNARALARKLNATRLVDAEAKDIEDLGDFYYDGREYVTRTPSNIEVKSGAKAMRFFFTLQDGRGKRAVTVQHNGLVGDLEKR